MHYQEFAPCEELRPYVKTFYLYESGPSGIADNAFATGCIELMFNLGDSQWQIVQDGNLVTTPAIELWGQLIEPLKFVTKPKTRMLGIRFYPHTAAVFLNDDVRLFNNRVTDFTSVAGNTVVELRQALLESPALQHQFSLVEIFLIKRLRHADKKRTQLLMMEAAIAEMKSDDFFANIQDVAGRLGISSRYLQKMFVQHSGLAPKLFHKINRFQKGLVLTTKGELPLTSIAYECGYFDQSHFIRDFKTFTGVSPSEYHPASVSALLASPNK